MLAFASLVFVGCKSELVDKFEWFDDDEEEDDDEDGDMGKLAFALLLL